jgi:hypothetical protein
MKASADVFPTFARKENLESTFARDVLVLVYKNRK